MEKFLFTDGSSGVREATSRRELEDWVAAAPDTSAIRIWIFGRSEWMTYPAFSSRFPVSKKAGREQAAAVTPVTIPASRSSRWKRRLPAYAFIAVCVFLVFNFTRLRWEKPTEIKVMAPRPANVPVMDIDSLIADIEYVRGEKIDRNTKSNLRLRNTWPDAILLQAAATKEVSDRRNRFSLITLKVDNTTGHTIDEAVVILHAWNSGQATAVDTFHFNQIGYNRSAERLLSREVKADSISVAFGSILAKSFNFCYSMSRDNPSGNYNDRWFCRNN